MVRLQNSISGRDYAVQQKERKNQISKNQMKTTLIRPEVNTTWRAGNDYARRGSAV